MYYINSLSLFQLNNVAQTKRMMLVYTSVHYQSNAYIVQFLESLFTKKEILGFQILFEKGLTCKIKAALFVAFYIFTDLKPFLTSSSILNIKFRYE